MPFWPIKPSTVPGEGMGKRKSLKLFSLKRWLQSFSSSSGRLTMLMALKGHFLTHIPQPLHRVSDMTALFPSTLMASTLLRTIGQKLTQTWLHFLTLHLSWLSTAIRVMAKLPTMKITTKL
jgi:hypothetical protein